MEDVIEKERVNVLNKSSCPGSSATIKQQTSTPVIHRLIAMPPKDVLVPCSTHSLVINVQPTFPTTALSVLVKNVDRIVPTTRPTTMIEHPMELVVRRLHGFPGSGCHDS
jgi:hypothetical protein